MYVRPDLRAASVSLPQPTPLPTFVGTPLDPMRGCAVVIVAYEAESTIESVLDRIPTTVSGRIGAILVSDDGSTDGTAALARRWANDHPDVPVTVVRHPINKGYGGNQKFCYRWAIDHGFAHAVMVHGDGQYAPELVADMLAPLLDGVADVVFGSRMLDRGAARRGGMPRYKYVGNRVLTTFQNRMSGLSLSEWHSGYRAYALASLDRIRFAGMSDDFDFDTEIILQHADIGSRISEIAIPTFYGDEKCRVNGMKYAADVVVDVIRHRRRKLAPAA